MTLWLSQVDSLPKGIGDFGGHIGELMGFSESQVDSLPKGIGDLFVSI